LEEHTQLERVSIITVRTNVIIWDTQTPVTLEQRPLEQILLELTMEVQSDQLLVDPIAQTLPTASIPQ
jgi:hypothetical protein